jgi:Rieske Fe-S protein
MTAALPPDPTALSRRRLLAGAGLAAAALGGLSACGGEAGAGAGAGASSAGPVTAPTADIPVGGGTIFPDAQTVITQPVAGQFKAFSSICTHARCPVTEVTDTINCVCHGSKFALADGARVAGPATKPLPARTATVQGDSVSVTG